MKQYILTNPMARQHTRNPKSEKDAPVVIAPEQGKDKKADVIYLGIDVHLRQQVVCRKVDAATPQPAQRFGPEQLKDWVAKQQTLAHKVVCCYEAGPFGYGLQRHLEGTGVECLVVRPQLWDAHGQRVKTDGRDARALVEGLARYKEGNSKALALVKVPDELSEQRRALTRHRASLVEEKRRMSQKARGRLLTLGVEVAFEWWHPKAWKACQASQPQWQLEMLESEREVLLALEKGIEKCDQRIEALARPAAQRPKGLGALSEHVISNEIIDWNRFNNRRQVSSYTGLCPSEFSSGGSRRQGSITKHGNRRLRTVLVEAAWRLIRHQPGWKRLEKLQQRMLHANGKRPGSKKKMIVELARGLAVDLWRLYTGRATMADLGLQPA
jgi:transposase